MGDGGPADGEYLSPEQLRDLDDDAFFEAYQAGRVERRTDALTEENWEEACRLNFGLVSLIADLSSPSSLSYPTCSLRETGN